MIKDNNVSNTANIALHKIAGGGLGGNQRDGSLVIYVDGDMGNDGNSGLDPAHAKQTIQSAVDRIALTPWSTIYVAPKNIASTDTDPASYAETVIIPVTAEGTAIIGTGRGRTQGGLPQIRIGAGTTAMLTVRAASCLVANMGFNGASSTGGGVFLDDDAGTSKVAFGFSAINCHFKNCKTHATSAATGGAIYSNGANQPWQVLVDGCHFYNCLGGIVTAAGGTPVKDWVIKNCEFCSDTNANVDADIYFATAASGVTINNCLFQTPDVPTIASGGGVGRYINAASGTVGVLANCTFACTVQGSGAKTFGATGNAVVLPTTVRISGCFGECESTSAGNTVLRTL